MTTNAEQNMVNMLALRDNDGHLYLIAREVLELGRVPDDQVETLTKQFRDSEDVSGFIFNTSVAPSLVRLPQTGASDSAQLANLDLSMTLQQYQQMLQLMSNMAKAQHDTMVNVIRKLAG